MLGSTIGISWNCTFDSLAYFRTSVVLKGPQCINSFVFELLAIHVLFNRGYEILDMRVQVGSDFVAEQLQNFESSVTDLFV